MNKLDCLKQYNSKERELNRLNAKLKVIDLKLENYDKVKAATISDMPTHRESSKGNSIVERSVSSREDLLEERKKLEIEIAELQVYFEDIDGMLKCMSYIDRWLLKNMYIERKPFKMIVAEYNEEIGIQEPKSISNRYWKIRNRLKKGGEYNGLHKD